MNVELFLQKNPAVGLLIGIWSIAWKGIALWKAARRDNKIWYVVMLVINTVGVLEIIYILFFSKDKQTNVQHEKEKKSKKSK